MTDLCPKDRRTHAPPCDELAATMNSLAKTTSELADVKSQMFLMQETLHETRDAVLAMKDILDAWNNTKGFVRTLQLLGAVAKWTLAMGVTIGAIWAAITYHK